MPATTKIYLGADLLADFTGFATVQALTTHTASPALHVTDAERTSWNAKLGPDALTGYAGQTWVTAQLAGYVTTASQTATLASYATQSWVTQQIAAKSHIRIILTDSLPLEGVADAIYLVPRGWQNPPAADDTIREQYIWASGEWVRIGDTGLSLDGYAEQTWVTARLDNYITRAALAETHYTKEQTDAAVTQAKTAVLQAAQTYADGQITAADADTLHVAPPLTQAAYNALEPPRARCLYIIKD